MGAVMRDRTDHDHGLRIEHIVPGPILRWNTEHPDKQVRVGDFIVSTCGTHLTTGRGIVDFARGGRLQLTIRRGASLPTAKVRRVERSLASMHRVDIPRDVTGAVSRGCNLDVVGASGSVDRRLLGDVGGGSAPSQQATVSASSGVPVVADDRDDIITSQAAVSATAVSVDAAR